MVNLTARKDKNEVGCLCTLCKFTDGLDANNITYWQPARKVQKLELTLDDTANPSWPKKGDCLQESLNSLDWSRVRSDYPTLISTSAKRLREGLQRIYLPPVLHQELLAATTMAADECQREVI